MSTAVIALSMCLLGAAILTVAHLGREGTLSSRYVKVLAVLCVLGLVAMTATDWINAASADDAGDFWGRRSVVSGVLSTLLLVGAGYLAFEARENNEQRTLSASLATGAFGGCVDHVLDIDLALGLLREPRELPARREARATGNAGKPLRWLRERREELPTPAEERPDEAPVPLEEGRPWRAELVDECVRRLMAGLRDWAPLLSQTRDGVAVLGRLSELRNDLLDLQQSVRDAAGKPEALDQVTSQVDAIQRECRVLALGLEIGTGLPLPQLRRGVQSPELLFRGVVPPPSFQVLFRQGPRIFRSSPEPASADWSREPAVLAEFRGRFGKERTYRELPRVPAQEPRVAAATDAGLPAAK